MYSVVNILQSIIVKNVKKLCLSRRTLTKQKQDKKKEEAVENRAISSG
jgi:hypothetical protein